MYIYAPLISPGTQIRLLRIDVTPESSSPVHIRFTMTTWSLDDIPDYAALSYTWGFGAVKSNILIDGQVLGLRENATKALHQALPHVLATGLQYLWMDSICINQSALEEKGQQVRIMHSIFERARQVYACLGPHDADSSLLFQALGLVDCEGTGDAAVDFWQKASNKTTMHLHEALEHFGERPYWNRLWIIQELHQAAKSPWILCGEGHILLDSLFIVKKHLTTRVGPPLGTVLEFCCRTRYSRHPAASLPNTIANFVSWLCEDPRDRVYGLLPLIELPKSLPPINPDYTISALVLAVRLLPYYQSYSSIYLGSDLDDISWLPDFRELLAALGVNSEAVRYVQQSEESTNLRFDTLCSLQATACRLEGTQDSTQALRIAPCNPDCMYNSYSHRIKPQDHAMESHSSVVVLTIPDFSVGYATSRARPGDYLLKIKGIYGHFSPQFLVGRKSCHEDPVIELVGKAWLEPGNNFCGTLWSKRSCRDTIPAAFDISFDWFDLIALLASGPRIEPERSLHVESRPSLEWYDELVTGSPCSSFGRVVPSDSVEF